jgi:CRISPR-associated endonuclease Csn1
MRDRLLSRLARGILPVRWKTRAECSMIRRKERHMNWRLGLDLGTNSIGWSVLSLNERNEVEKLEDMGVRIFSDGREPNGEPLAVARRTARGIRRNLLRRKIRRRNLFRLLQEDGLFPSLREEAAELKQLDPYALRAKALDERLESHELGRALFYLGVRRGFKSNRKDKPEERLDPNADTGTDKLQAKEDGKLKQAEKILLFQAELDKNECRTLGEYLHKKRMAVTTTGKADNKQYPSGQARFSPEKTRYYPVRQMYEDEFAAIKAKQEALYPALGWDAIHKAIFYQRPLRPQERGKCQFMPDKERTFKATPCSQQFRILQEVFNLTYASLGKHSEPLSKEQQDILIAALDTQETMAFSKMQKLLKLTGTATFNLEKGGREKLLGNATACEMRKDKYFGTIWDTLPLAEQDALVETLITADEDSEAERFLEKYALTEEQRKAILRFPFPSGTASFCKEATEALVAEMQKTRKQYHEAATEVEKYDLLPYYGKVLSGSTMGAGKWNGIGEPDPKYGKNPNKDELQYGKIANPTVHVALNQTRVVVNALIKKYGKPTQIALELSRDLKASREEKAKIQKRQTDGARRNAILNKAINDACPAITFPNRSDRLKWRLWEELGQEGMPRRCLYCGEVIKGSDIFSSDIEVEHILPFSRTLLDAESNLTVAHRRCNAFKKEDSPYEAFHANPAGYKWEAILERVAQLKNPVKRRRFSADAMESFEKESSFIARQLTDNAYLSKISLRYLKTICADIWAVNGGMTKLLRDKWEIDEILKRRIGEREAAYFNLKTEQIGTFKKNRFDHRHHALDAVVIALTDRSTVKNVADESGKGYRDTLQNRVKVPPFPFGRAEIIEKMRNIVVSFKPDHGVQGKLSKETALGRIRQETLLPIKELTENDVPHIKDTRVRGAFEQRLAETKDFKAVVKEMQKDYPQIRVFRPCFVNRMNLTALKTKKNIDDIVDAGIRKDLNDFIDAGKKLEQALADFSKETGIKRVRCKTFAQAPIVIPPKKDKPLSVTRYYNPEDYFAALVWEIPPAKTGAKPKYEAQYVRRTEIDKNEKPTEKRPHPAARKVCVLCKDDYIEFTENGICKKARIMGFSATDNRIDVRPIFATEDARSWIIATAEQVLEKGWKSVEGQNYISVNVLFGDYATHKIRVSPIGIVNRKAT